MGILAKAISFAALAHVDQTDKGGRAYILHPLRMMMRLRTSDEELMAIAVLHDVVEDRDVTFEQLRELGMTPRVIEGVDALTRRPGESYEAFIERAIQNHDAALVKREDLRDNSDLTRLKGVTAKDIERMSKYMRAFQRIDTYLG